MEAAVVSHSRWTFAQWGIVVLAALQLAWAIAGLIAEPSFHFGEGAPTKIVLGVDFNGVHALSGFLLFGPAFFFALKPRWAVLYAVFVAAALIITGIWAAFSTSPAGIFAFPDNTADAILHLTTGALFATVAAIQLGLDRRVTLGAPKPS
jgi:cytochrome b